MPDTQLGSLLVSLKIGAADAKEIVSIAKSGHYQVACQKHFDVTHPQHETLGLKNVSEVFLIC
jgi:hypothetical protein